MPAWAVVSQEECEMAQNRTINIGNDTGVIPKGTIVWKKCFVVERMKCSCGCDGTEDISNHVVVKLEVLAAGIVPYESRCLSNQYDERKCRVPKAKVLGIYTMRSGSTFSRHKKAFSSHDENFVYQVGRIVKPDRWDNSPGNVCTGGIHVFRTRAEAERY